MSDIMNPVPIHEKLALTVKEAAAYSNIGMDLVDKLLHTPNCPFVLFVGTMKLVKRKEFEQFIRQKLIILPCTIEKIEPMRYNLECFFGSFLNFREKS